MRPYKTLLFLFFIGLGLLAVGEFFSDGLQIGDFQIRFFTPSKEFLTEAAPQNQRVDKNKLIQLQETTNALVEEDTSLFANDSARFSLDEDSLANDPASVAFHIDSTARIQYPAGDSTILNSFFSILDSARKGNASVRILHIGDSQIEGDRISGYLRQRLQQEYGGCGPGLVPFSEDLASRLYLKIVSSSVPTKFSLYGKPKKGPHNQYSVLHSFFRFKGDTANPILPVSEKVQYSLNGQGFRRTNYFERATLLCRNTTSTLDLKFGSTGSDQTNLHFLPSDSLRFISWNSNRPVRQFGFRTQSRPETDFYGICLDCKNGVSVDNIPLRGTSGLELLKINPRFLQEQIRRLNVKMVILQFGVNVVPYNSKTYQWYETGLVNVIRTIKRAAPDVQVLVVGVSDMAHKQDGNWASFETIPMVIEAQKKACKRTNSAFWDLFKVMGGKNSILAWAKTNPALAGKDYIHLTPKGAQVIGEFLFQSITSDYKRFKTRIENSIQ